MSTATSHWNRVSRRPLADHGMPQFDFTQGQVNKLYAYIRASAREALGTRKPSGEDAGASHF